MMSFLGEIKRRKVFQVAAVYAVVAWLMVQIVATVEAPLNLPDWVDTLVILLLAIGFPITLIISWAFNLTSEGLVRDRTDASSARSGGRTLEYALIGLLVLAVGFLFIDDYLLDGSTSDAQTENVEAAVLPKVAVLPCDNLSPRAEDAYFSAGMHDEILNQLVKLSGLLVVSRTSVLRYANPEQRPAIPQIARELNAQGVMECTVRFAGTSVLVTAQLINPETDAQVFSDTYPADLSDLSSVFAIQADIAMNVANALEASFSDEDQARTEQVPTESAEAYALYLQSLERGHVEAIGLLDRAIAVDPQFAVAYAQKALRITYQLRDTVSATASVDDPAEMASTVIELAERALDIDPTIGRAHFALAEVHLQFWRWRQAEMAYAEALRLDPNDANLLGRYGWFSTYVGEYERASRFARRVEELTPNGGGYFDLGYAYAAAGDTQAAADAFRRAVAISPTWPLGHMFLGKMAARRGNIESAMEEMRIAETLYGRNFGPLSIAEIAHSLAQMGRQDVVERLYRLFVDRARSEEIAPGVWATMYLALGEEDKAYDALTTVVEEVENEQPDAGFNALMNLKLRISGDPVLSTRRFEEVLERIGSLD